VNGDRVRRPRPATTVATGALLATLCLGSTLPASATTMHAGGPAAGAATSLEPATQRVVVTLRDAPDLSGLPGLDRGQRLSSLIHRLRAHADASQAPLRGRLKVLEARGEVSSQTSLWVANAISVTATATAVRELAARPDVASVTPDAITVVPTAAPVEPNLAAVHAPDLWAAGQTGQGVVVATLDTGVDLTNPDLAARWRGGTNSWFDPYGQHPTTPADLDGHGTATAGLVVGGADGGTSYGMAPGATLIAARIFDDRGATTTTAMHQAFQWVLDPDHDPATDDAPRVVNGSWALGAGPSCNLTFQPDVQALRAAGILPVFSAGNFGPTASTSASPANYPESLSVGATDAGDVVWAYSSAGPSTCGGRTRVFPDLVAPGVSVLSADRFGGYQFLTGTSIAAPHVAGAAALLIGAHPGLAVTSVQSALTSAAADLGPAGPDNRYGNGRLDVAAADAWAASTPDYSLTATPATLTTTAGGSASSTLAVVPVNGFAASTTPFVQGLPAGASASVTPAVLGPGAWGATLVVTTTTGVTPGSYPLTVTASGGGLTRSVPATLTVTAPPDFGLTASAIRLTIRRGQSASTTIGVTTTGGASMPVALAVSHLPTGVTATWTGNPVTAPGSATLRLAVATNAKTGSYPLVVRGTSGSWSHTISLVLLLR
jgi:subtilisin family serine protease